MLYEREMYTDMMKLLENANLEGKSEALMLLGHCDLNGIGSDLDLMEAFNYSSGLEKIFTFPLYVCSEFAMEKELVSKATIRKLFITIKWQQIKRILKLCTW